MEYTQEITLDVNHAAAYAVVHAKQGDSGTRYVKATICANGQKITPGTDVSAVFNFIKPDETSGMEPATINDDGTITFELKEQTLAVPGWVSADLSLVKGVDILSTASFKINVQKKPCSANRAASSNEFLLLIKATDSANQAAARANQAADAAQKFVLSQAPGVGENAAMSQKAVTSELYGLVPVEFEVGNLASSNGGLNPAPNNDRLRSSYIDLAPVLYITSTDETYPVFVYAFAADHSYLGAMGGWFEKVEKREILEKYPTAVYFRIVVKKFNNTALTPEDVYGKIVCMRSKFITEPLTVAHPHAQYFQVTWNGILSLKPEFRGEPTSTKRPDGVSDNGVGYAGSRNGELPEDLVIPEMVGNTVVTSLAVGAFYFNRAVRNVTIPRTVKTIPDYCFCNCTIENLEKTEHITTIGKNAFHKSNLKRAYFPNLEAMGTTSLAQCSYLTYAHIGKVTSIPTDAFFCSRYLSSIENTGVITSVGDCALFNTNSLVKADFVKDVQTAGTTAFACTGLDFEWELLPEEGMGDNATPEKYNPKDTDFWSDCEFTPCKNPLPTHFCQSDPRWEDRVISVIDPDPNPVTYNRGCQLFCIIHAYCGLNQHPMSSVMEFENVINEIDPDVLKNYYIKWSNVEPVAKALGMTVTNYSHFDAANLKALYDALAAGNYAILATSAGSLDASGKADGKMTGHVVLAYGVTPNGDLLIADSTYRYWNNKEAGGAKYTVPYRSLCIPKYSDTATITFCILEKNPDFTGGSAVSKALDEIIAMQEELIGV